MKANTSAAVPANAKMPHDRIPSPHHHCETTRRPTDSISTVARGSSGIKVPDHAAAVLARVTRYAPSRLLFPRKRSTPHLSPRRRRMSARTRTETLDALIARLLTDQWDPTIATLGVPGASHHTSDHGVTCRPDV